MGIKIKKTDMRNFMTQSLSLVRQEQPHGTVPAPRIPVLPFLFHFFLFHIPRLKYSSFSGQAAKISSVPDLILSSLSS
jgi:hypothetical protein